LFTVGRKSSCGKKLLIERGKIKMPLVTMIGSAMIFVGLIVVMFTPKEHVVTRYMINNIRYGTDGLKND
jgi:uncharacterized membrane protein